MAQHPPTHHLISPRPSGLCRLETLNDLPTAHHFGTHVMSLKDIVTTPQGACHLHRICCHARRLLLNPPRAFVCHSTGHRQRSKTYMDLTWCRCATSVTASASILWDLRIAAAVTHPRTAVRIAANLSGLGTLSNLSKQSSLSVTDPKIMFAIVFRVCSSCWRPKAQCPISLYQLPA